MSKSVRHWWPVDRRKTEGREAQGREVQDRAATDKSWEQTERSWDKRAEALASTTSLRTFRKNPNLPGIRKKTRKHLSWKTLHYLHSHDSSGLLRKYFWRHPLKHGAGLARNLLRSLRGKPTYIRDDDFFFYGLKNTEELCKKLENPLTLLVVGFSYCHKPFECPAGRFTDACYHDPANEVCGQCFIGKSVHFLPKDEARERIIPLFITTVHYLGDEMVKLRQTRPDCDPLFLITACELTLEMFGFVGASVGFKGIGVRLDGQICNTMRAFEASEEGVKPGMAIVTDPTQARMMEVYREINLSFQPETLMDNDEGVVGAGPIKNVSLDREELIATDRIF